MTSVSRLSGSCAATLADEFILGSYAQAEVRQADGLLCRSGGAPMSCRSLWRRRAPPRSPGARNMHCHTQVERSTRAGQQTPRALISWSMIPFPSAPQNAAQKNSRLAGGAQ